MALIFQELKEFKTQYKNLFHRNILNNNINKIFIIEPVKNNELYEYFDKSCFIEKIFEKSYRIKNYSL